VGGGSAFQGCQGLATNSLSFSAITGGNSTTTPTTPVAVAAIGTTGATANVMVTNTGASPTNGWKVAATT
jgi:hypothetical protein